MTDSMPIVFLVRVLMTGAFALSLGALAALGGCAATPNQGQVSRLSAEDLARLTPPPNPQVPLAEVIAWSDAGASVQAIIKKLQDSGTFYNLTAQQIVDISKQGVDQRVIDHLVAAQEKARQATLLTQLADRDARAAQDLERERNRRRALQQHFGPWQYGYGAYGGTWGPRYGFGWGIGAPYYYDPFFKTWRPRW